MNSWARRSMADSITALGSAGYPALVADLARLLECIDFDDLEVTRLAETEAIIEDVLLATSLSELIPALHRIVIAFDLKHCTIHVLEERSSISFTTKVVTTYPQAWVDNYIARGYGTIDPVVSECISRTDRFYWDEIVSTHPLVLKFWKDASIHGIAQSGFSLSYSHAARGSASDVIRGSIRGREAPRTCQLPQERPLHRRISPFGSDQYTNGRR